MELAGEVEVLGLSETVVARVMSDGVMREGRGRPVIREVRW